MRVGRSTVNNWFHEMRDPSAKALLEIIEALPKIAAAAKDFVKLYLEPIAQDE
jgi:hypothetical protein